MEILKEKVKQKISEIFLYLKRHKVLVIIFLIFLFSLSLVYKIYIFNFKYKNLEENMRIDVNVQKIEKVSSDKISYLVKYNNDKFILNIYKDKYQNLNNSNNIENLSKYSIYKYGDVLTLRGKIKIPEKLGNPYEFDYKKYLNSKNIVGEIVTYSVSIKDVKFQNVFFKVAYNIKDLVSTKIKNMMELREYNLFKSMLYGEDNELDDDIKENFNKCGLSHLLAVSGSNIVSLMMVLNYILKKLNKKNSVFLTLFVIFVFCIFCSFELSIIRASLMIFISTIYQKNEKKINIFLKMLISYVVLLLYNPFYIFNVGLLMSYLAIVGIIIYQNTFFSFFDVKVKNILNIMYVKPRGIKAILYFLLCAIFYSISFTASSVILIIPIQIYYFNSFNLITFLSN